MSTIGSITRRTPLTGINNPAYQVSKNAYNDSLVVASAAPNGAMVVRDSAQADGWGFLDPGIVWFDSALAGTDCTAELQAVHDALPATGGTIYVPGNTSAYLLSGAGVTISKGVRLIGDGSGEHGATGSTTFQYTGSSQAFIITGTTRSSVELERMQIDGDSNANAGVIGIHINGPSSVVLRDVHVRRFLGTGGNRGIGIRVYTPTGGQGHFFSAEHCYIHANGKGLVFAGQSSDNPPNGPVLINTRIISNSSHGIEMTIANFTGFTMIGGELAFNEGSGAVIGGRNQTFIGVDIEGNTLYGLDTDTNTDVGLIAINCPGLTNSTNRGKITFLADVNGIGVGITTGAVSLKGYITSSTTWNPGSLADGETAQTEVTLAGAEAGDPAVVGLTTLPTIAHLTAHVINVDTVKVVLTNRSGGVLDVASGTLRIGVLKQ